MTNLSRLKKLSSYLIDIFAYVIMICLVSVVGGSMMVSITPVITELLEQIQNSDSMREIVISSVHLAIITLAAIWLAIVSILSIFMVSILSTIWKAPTNPSDTP